MVEGLERFVNYEPLRRVHECDSFATDGLALWPAFNFQFAWSSGTVAGRSAGWQRPTR